MALSIDMEKTLALYQAICIYVKMGLVGVTSVGTL